MNEPDNQKKDDKRTVPMSSGEGGEEYSEEVS